MAVLFASLSLATAASSSFAPPAVAASGPSVSVQLTGLGATRTAGPKTVSAASFTRSVGTASAARTCRIASGTPLAALRALGVTFVVKDFGRCSLNVIDSASLFVDSVRGVAGTGMQGWSYKVNNRAGSAGAADPKGPFGSGALRSGSKVLWFWCRYDPQTYACQPNLVIVAPTRVGRARTFTVEVREYDDAGKAKPAADALVRIPGVGEATTGPTGKVSFTALKTVGAMEVKAVEGRMFVSGGGRPEAFPARVTVY